MSILKQVLTNDLASMFRRRSAEHSRSRSAEARLEESGDRDSPSGTASPEKGLRAVILNWKDGENDPFTVVNKTLRHYFHACGKNVEVIEISDRDWTSRLAALAPAGVEFALTWQGLGSRVKVGEAGESLWDHLRIPLICIHGDHPSHMPANHELESRYCFHLYANAEAARYSNRHFRSARGASVIDIPQLHRERHLPQRVGDYFVIVKNIDDPHLTEKAWQERLRKPVFDAYMVAAETLKSQMRQEPYLESHDLLDELITRHGLEWLSPTVDIAAYHEYHCHLDLYLRSYKAILAVGALREFPLRVYGRGWDRVAQNSPPGHVFEPGRNMVDSQELYYTRFGLVDISPSKGLHDRTRRAMANGAGFVSSANLEDSFADIGRFDSLFFSFKGDDLVNKCAAVVNGPDAHFALAQQFADTYHNRFHFKEFVHRIDQFAKLARNA